MEIIVGDGAIMVGVVEYRDHYGRGSVLAFELSAAAYDEIEKILLDAGYSFLFPHGPGSTITLPSIDITRERTSMQAQQDAVKAEERRIGGAVILSRDEYARLDPDRD